MEAPIVDSTSISSQGTKDRYHFVFISASFLGVVILFPWNILITVTSYWNYKFRNVSLDNNEDIVDPSDEDELTELQLLYTSYLAIASNVPNATFVILHALFGHHFNIKLRLYGSLIGVIIILALITILSFLDSDGWQKTFLDVNMVAIAILNVFSAVFQGATTAVLGLFPAEYLGSMGSGCGIGGLIPSVMNIAILGASQNSSQIVGISCFCICTSLAAVCLGVLFVLNGNKFYQTYASSITAKEKLLRDKDENTTTANLTNDLKIYISIIKDSWMYQIAIFLTFTVCLSVFPAVTDLIQPIQKGETKTEWEDIYFIPVCCFVLFNFGDYLGKELATRLRWPKPSKTGQLIILSMSIIRAGMIPLFMFCNVAPSNRSTEVVFSSEWWYIVFMALFSISNGYIGNIGFMFAPKVVASEYQDVAAAFTVAMLVGGCGVGSVISNSIVKML